MKITPTSLTINQLFGAPNEQYVIPTYQRRYSWNQKQVIELIEDVGLIEETDTHLLGSIVCLAGHHRAGVNQLELVDGQQRLTTIAILLECIRQHLEENERKEEAFEVTQLLNAKPLAGKSVAKVLLESIDADDFADLVQSIERKFNNNNLERAFAIIRDEIKSAKLDEVITFLYRLRNQAIVIRLDVSEAKDAFKLFETINNRGLRLSPTDIIKNFLLGNAARLSSSQLDLARKAWTLLLRHLDGTNPDAFFRYYLMAQQRTRIYTSEIVATFKTLFMKGVTEASLLPDRHNYADEEPSAEEDSEATTEAKETAPNAPKVEQISFPAFLDHLVKCAQAYGEIVLAKTGDDRIDRHLRNLRMIKSAQTYVFLMYLRVGECKPAHFRQILEITENFVLRRHICQKRSNETESLFAELCDVDPKSPIERTKEAYRSLCPSDDQFKSSFVEADFPASLIERARYCLEQIEISLHGKHDELSVLGPDDVHVEHIIPQKIKTRKAKEEFGDWVEYLGKESEENHPKYVGRIGNLTLFAGALNIGASNNPFGKKKTAYKKSSILITKELAQRSNFRFSDVNKRSLELAGAAINIWPKP
jgi:hypothetical protein